MTSQNKKIDLEGSATRQIAQSAKNPDTRSQKDTSALLKILQLESDLRKIRSERELTYFLANETRTVLGYRQSFVFRKRGKWRLEAVSSVTNFDRNAPINREIRSFVSEINKKKSPEKATLVSLGSQERLPVLNAHTFSCGIWMPFKTRKGRIFGGMLILHEREWPESVLPLCERVCEASAHAWQALRGESLERKYRIPKKLTLVLLAAVLIAGAFIRIPLTVLAPVEVSSEERLAVTVPLQGVIQNVEISPNEWVEAGQVIARIDDTELRNALSVAQQQVIVARARVDQLQNASFSDRAAARELRVAEAELALAQTELEIAEARLQRVDIRAEKAGIAIFDNPNTLVGLPVRVGQGIMEIVSPDTPEFTIRLPVIDHINLEEGSKVRVFLDSRPLAPIDAILTRNSFRAQSQPDGSFAYTLKATANDLNDLGGVRIGAYGTAQLQGEEHSLYFNIFRRPLTWFRQKTGM
jgi:hypothetical protein